MVFTPNDILPNILAVRAPQTAAAVMDKRSATAIKPAEVGLLGHYWVCYRGSWVLWIPDPATSYESADGIRSHAGSWTLRSH